jgi:hypothetical protein
MSWDYSVGNLAQRCANAPAAVAPAAGDSLLSLDHLANGYPDQEAAFTWRSDGTYAADVDINMLASASDRSDAPTGWRDLLLALAGTPGLGSFPPDWNTYASRTALRLYRPVFQEFDVLPGENFKMRASIYVPTASDATGVQVEVIDTWSGLGWNGSAWVDGGVLESQSVMDTWEEIDEVITADANRDVRSSYRVVISPIATSYSATTYVYASANGGALDGSPAMIGEADLVALVGHNIPDSATVTVGTITLPISAVSCAVTDTASYAQVWTLDIQMPAGNQPRPKLGELWIGMKRIFLRGPDPGITVKEGDPNQIRLETAQGRLEILSDQRLPAEAISLKIRTFTAEAFAQYKNELQRGTRFGADPVLLLPDAALEGSGRVIFGRIGQEISYSHQETTFKSFTVDFRESPLSNDAGV